MTIERPMFPPRREASPFRVVAGIDFAPSPDQPEDRPGPTADHERILSPTCKNKRLRDRRHDAWRMADSIRDYWHARLKFDDAISRAQRMGTPEGRFHPPCDHDDRWAMLAKYREAIAQQMLTPAPDAAAITWKQNALARGKYEYTGLKPDRLKHAIADDLAFLAAHPVRRSNSETMAHRREFKEAMRQRIRDVAASRDLSDEEIKPVLKLKHHEIARFTEVYGVNLEWLLEGKGRIFESGTP